MSKKKYIYIFSSTIFVIVISLMVVLFFKAMDTSKEIPNLTLEVNSKDDPVITGNNQVKKECNCKYNNVLSSKMNWNEFVNYFESESVDYRIDDLGEMECLEVNFNTETKLTIKRLKGSLQISRIELIKNPRSNQCIKILEKYEKEKLTFLEINDMF